MRQLTIEIEGKKYPCRQTMGAMLRFKQETGKDVSQISNDFSDLCAYLYCCVVSACKHDNIAFDYSLLDFADSLTPKDLEQWTDAISETNGGEDAAGEGAKKN